MQVFSVVLNAAVLGTFHIPVWNTFSINIFTVVGNFHLYHLSWICAVGIWSYYRVNYISIFRFHNTKSNTLKLLNEAATSMVVFCACLLLYLISSEETSRLYSYKISYLSAFAVILFLAVFKIYHALKYGASHAYSRGVFSTDVLKKLLLTPYYASTFRENYAGDILQSFTKVVSDALEASCWVVSGQFWYSGKDDITDTSLTCSNIGLQYAIAACISFLIWIRTAQSLRKFVSTGKIRHVVNAIKYFVGILVVFYGVFLELDYWYVIIVFPVSIFKWYWDTVVDWGLIEGLNIRGMMGLRVEKFGSFNSPMNEKRERTIHDVLLRKNLMYKKPAVYYVAMLLNLLLRFLWVISLMPHDKIVSILGPFFSIYLGSLEILRRFIWGIFKVEHEHLLHCNERVVGFRKAAIFDADVATILRRSPSDPPAVDSDLCHPLLSTTGISDARLDHFDEMREHAGQMFEKLLDNVIFDEYNVAGGDFAPDAISK